MYGLLFKKDILKSFTLKTQFPALDSSALPKEDKPLCQPPLKYVAAVLQVLAPVSSPFHLPDILFLQKGRAEGKFCRSNSDR